MTGSHDTSEAGRLESLWAGRFGDEYAERNKDASRGRDIFWRWLLAQYKVGTILEVGCNIGGNLRWIAETLPPKNVYGIDVNAVALERLRQAIPGVNAVLSAAKALPFQEAQFDLVFTSGVLIHQPEDTLKAVMSEIVRCSRRYVLCLEYFSKETVEVPYRGNERALFKRDYGYLYQELRPSLKLLEKKELRKKDGWDDVTCWLFERSAGAA